MTDWWAKRALARLATVDLVHRSGRWHVQLSVRYSVLVLGASLVDPDGPLLGAVYYPAIDQLWLGGRENPTTVNGEPVPTLLSQPLSEVSVATYLHPRHFGDQRLRRVAVGDCLRRDGADPRVGVS